MNGSFILDSNIIIEVFRGNKETIKKVSSITVAYVPVIVLGELYYGANKSQKVDLRKQEILDLEKEVTVLNISNETAKIYGELKNELKKKGKPIPENDIWIAAIVKEYSIPLLTKDRHFSHFPDLEITLLED